jgi:hypothetical protein
MLVKDSSLSAAMIEEELLLLLRLTSPCCRRQQASKCRRANQRRLIVRPLRRLTRHWFYKRRTTAGPRLLLLLLPSYQETPVPRLLLRMAAVPAIRRSAKATEQVLVVAATTALRAGHHCPCFHPYKAPPRNCHYRTLPRKLFDCRNKHSPREETEEVMNKVRPVEKVRRY